MTRGEDIARPAWEPWDDDDEVEQLRGALDTLLRWYNEHPARDKAAELWLQSQHTKDWYIGDATEAEWLTAYEWVDQV